MNQVWVSDMTYIQTKEGWMYLTVIIDLFNRKVVGWAMSESTTLNILGLSYYQTKDIWIRIFTQHNSGNNRFYFYGLAGWRFKPPFGALYLIYSSDNYQDFDIPQQIRSNILFLKLTYPINVIK